MIQLAYRIHGVALEGLPVAMPPLRVMAIDGMDGDPRLSAVWPHADLVSARRQVAAWMRSLSPGIEVSCLFTDRRETAARWVELLESRPSVETVFTVRSARDHGPQHGEEGGGDGVVGGAGQLVARLFGLYQFGESDVVLLADDDTEVGAAVALLWAWAAYRLERAPRGETPEWDKPFPWGYWLVSFADAEVGDAAFWAHLKGLLASGHLRLAFDERMQTPSPKVLIEAPDMDALEGGGDALGFEVGVSRALGAWSRQRAVERRMGVAEGKIPSGQDAAAYCDRLIDALEGRRELPCFAYREAAQGPLDSGWRFGCLEPDHVHDDHTLRLAPLARASRIVGLDDYVALPPGWVVTFEDGRFWVRAPGDERSLLDEGHMRRGGVAGRLAAPLRS